MKFTREQLERLLKVLKKESNDLVALPKFKKLLNNQWKQVNEQRSSNKAIAHKKLSPKQRIELNATLQETTKRVLVLNELTKIYIQRAASEVSPEDVPAESLAAALQKPLKYPMHPPEPRPPKRTRDERKEMGKGKAPRR